MGFFPCIYLFPHSCKSCIILHDMEGVFAPIRTRRVGKHIPMLSGGPLFGHPKGGDKNGRRGKGEERREKRKRTLKAAIHQGCWSGSWCSSDRCRRTCRLHPGNQTSTSANDGSGTTEMGRQLYPKAPDMRLPRTQQLSDGEIFYFIENGIRLTGMPGWSTGTPEGEKSSWQLVHFIRRLSRLTPEDVAIMEQFNPTSRAVIEEERNIEEFLKGGDAPPPAADAKADPHAGHRKE